MGNLFKCIDAGTKYCPCILAETKDCVSCSQLQGGEFCDCEWNGLCILNEYYMNNKKAKKNRRNYKGVLVNKELIDDKLYLLKIETDKDLVQELNRSGSYVFIRGEGEESHFDVPMSILDTEENKYIRILYKLRGCKTKTLNNSSEYIIRGPYWNGILGIKYLKEIKNSNCLVISKGMGQASVGLVIKEMFRNNNKVIFVLDKGDLDKVYIDNFINDKKIRILKYDIENEKEKILKLIEEKNIKLLFSAGSDLLHESIHEMLKYANKDIKLMTTNNSKLCCGEGICGSCTNRTKEGQRVKLCKGKVNQKIFY
ncbi:sulfide/dihydroorotate dehydrogenase-like FAD/NAD-binding protein [Anaerosalibacter bizertensis]|uniref:sulfide/dihydroorotate dehydrogenase-like FAD/NAD-binding protein n=1 Tax=Anaerosalibacter bizertensis TaxID=932217 RepID=UPI001C0EC920|nr:sulfide/dihydroorotate dehydrogenase-like FAD/NAD-binding protein [Anaerosalibacter bizertensis]MBU5293195.1 sulfide/dihydroorotate dehydrogenase-like FAD/NAD-binding protein [Anaerosalibacter bizertensis]